MISAVGVTDASSVQNATKARGRLSRIAGKFRSNAEKKEVSHRFGKGRFSVAAGRCLVCVCIVDTPLNTWNSDHRNNKQSGKEEQGQGTCSWEVVVFKSNLVNAK